MSERQIARAAGVLFAISILARLAGFVREQAIAAVFGTSAETDAYLMSFTLPNLIFVVVGGALATAFLPVITQREVCGEQFDDRRLASSVLNITVVGMVGLSMAGMVFAPTLVALLAHGFAPDQLALTIRLTRVLFPCAVLLALSGLLGALLNSYKKFAVPAVTSIAFSLTLIAGLFLLAPTMGIAGLAWATVLATVAQVAVQLPALHRSGYRHQLTAFDLRDEGVRKVGKLMLPAMLGTSVAQLYVTIDRILASGLPTGSIAALNFANKLMFLPFNLFVMTVSTAVYPYLSEHAARKQDKELGEATIFGLVLISIFTIPASVGLFVLAEPLVQLLFQRGAFDMRSTAMTAYALRFFALGLFAQGAYNIVNRTFFAMQDTLTPVKVSLFVVILNVVFSLLLIGPLQHGGLAFANSLASICNLVIIFYLLHRRLPAMSGGRLLWDLGKLSFASLVMGGAVYYLQFHLAAVWWDTSRLSGQAMALTMSILAGGGLYLMLLPFLHVQEVERLRHKVHRRLFKSRDGRLRVFISGYYGYGNAGDEAVLKVLLQKLQQSPQVKKVEVLAACPIGGVEGVTFVRRRSAWQVLNSLLRCDVLISGGGGLLQNVTSNRSLLFYLAIIEGARFTGAKVLMVANGVGPLGGGLLRWITGIIIRRCEYISVRDEHSVTELQQLGIIPGKISLVADPALLLPGGTDLAAVASKLGGLPEEYISVALRSWQQLPSVAELRKFLLQVEKQTGKTVLLVPMQEPADRKLALEINQFADFAITRPGLSPEELAAVFGAGRFTIAMRLHALIFSAASRVPVLALSYDPKVAAMAEAAGQRVLNKFAGLTGEELITEFITAWSQRDYFVQELEQALPSILERAEKGMAEMSAQLGKDEGGS